MQIIKTKLIKDKDERHWINSGFALQGCVYRFKPLLDKKDKIVKVLDVLCGDFVAVAALYTDRSVCLVKALCSVSCLIILNNKLIL